MVQVISENTLCSKGFTSIWETFLDKNNRNYDSYKFSYKFAFILFLSFLTNQKQGYGLQQVGGLVMRNISVFCWVALYFKAIPNSIDFYKGVFLHVIPVRIIVSGYHKSLHKSLVYHLLCLFCWQILFKIGALKNLASFTEKHLCWNLILRRLWTPPVAASDCISFYFWNNIITQISVKLHFFKIWRLSEIIRG